MKVYAVEWCPCVYESAYEVLSLHDTKIGAEDALKNRVAQKAADEKDMRDHGYPGYKESSAGRVREIEVSTTQGEPR